MQFHQYEDEEIPHLSGFLLKFTVSVNQEKTEQRANAFVIIHIGILFLTLFISRSHMDKVNGCRGHRED